MAEHELHSNRPISELFENVTAAREAGRAQYLDIADLKIQRLQAARKRLQSQLGPEHPRVKRLNAKATGVGALTAELKALADRTSVKSSEWAVCGRVLDSKGAPVTGAPVRLVDKEKKYAELLGSTNTEADGNFALVYSRDKLEVLLNEKVAPALYFSVMDTKGETLFSASEPIHCELGKLEHYAIRLGEKPPVTRRRQAIVRKATPVRKKTPTRRPKSKTAGKPKE